MVVYAVKVGRHIEFQDAHAFGTGFTHVAFEFSVVRSRLARSRAIEIKSVAHSVGERPSR